MFLERFYPDEYVDSSYGIDYQALYDRGIRGLLFDIDNTLVPHGKPETQRAVELFRRLEEMGTDRRTTVFIGDQLFTDVYGAKRSGIYSILVKPIHPKEEIQIVLKRYLERIVLYFYKKSLKK